jgi:tetratricopeptide (TPR) repeat protein
MLNFFLAIAVAAPPEASQARDLQEAYYHFSLGEQARLAGDPEGALSEYRKAQKLDWGSGAILVEEAKVLRDAGRITEAIGLGEQGAKLSPQDANAHQVLGQLYQLDSETAKDPKESLEKAAREYRASLGIQPVDLAVLSTLADLYSRGLQDHKAAAELLEKYVALDPGSPEATLQLGVQYLAAGDSEKAAQSFKHALELQPDSARAYASLGSIYAVAQQTDQAILHFRKALELEPGNVKVRLDLGEVLFRAQRYKEAEAEADAILARDPRSRFARNMRAACQRDLKDLDGALKTADELVGLYPDDPQAAFLKVTIAEARRDFPLSASVLETVLQRQSDLDPAATRIFLIHLGYAYEQLNRPADAADSFAKAKNLGGDPDAALLGYEVEALLQAKSYDKALQAVRAARGRFPEDTDLAGFEADALRELGQKTEAKELLENLIKKSPRDVKALDDLADFYQRTKQFGEAEAMLRKSLAVEPKNLRTLFELGASLERQKKIDEAESIFRQALVVQPDSAPVLNYLGYMNAERGANLEEALSLIERAATIDQENGAYQDSLGYALMRLNRADQAEIHFKKALLTQGQNAVVLDHFGDLLEKEGHLLEAVRYWKKALEGEDLEGELDRPRVERKLREALASLDVPKKNP